MTTRRSDQPITDDERRELAELIQRASDADLLRFKALVLVLSEGPDSPLYQEYTAKSQESIEAAAAWIEETFFQGSER